MSWHRRLLNVLRPERMHRELERELSFHIEERANELQGAGLSPEEAQRRARAQFGNYTVQLERTRDVDVVEGVEAVGRNLRHAARGLRRTPGFTATVVLTLALGIGANSAVFSAIDAVLLRPLPFPNAEELVTLAQFDPKQPQSGFVAPVRLEDWNRLNRTFQAITGYYAQDDSELSGEVPEKVKHAFVGAIQFLLLALARTHYLIDNCPHGAARHQWGRKPGVHSRCTLLDALGAGQVAIRPCRLQRDSQPPWHRDCNILYPSGFGRHRFAATGRWSD